MNEYHKIQSVYKRDPENNYKTLLFGEYSRPEFEYLRNNEWIFTEKVDGMNIRVMFDGEEKITFGGKTEKAQLPAPLVEHLQLLFLPQLSVFQEHFGEAPVCFYGEGYGGKIQKAGATYGGEQRFVLFDIRINRWWLKQDDVEEIANYFDELKVVPIVGKGALDDMISLVQDGRKSQWGDFIAEGIVARPAVELLARNGQRIIAKIKHKDFEENK